MTTKQVQLLLEYLGYDVTPDGIQGPKTHAAVLGFQNEYTAADLEPDGVAGAQTDDAIIQAVVSGWKRPEKTNQQGKPDAPAIDAEGTEDDEVTGLFWDSIPNFTREEFACKCGGKYCNGFPSEPKEDMVRIAQAIRTHFNRPATVISGLRCQKHNANEGGHVNSQHMYGEACDINVSGVPGATVLAWVQKYPGVRWAYQIPGTQNVHFDIPMGER